MNFFTAFRRPNLNMFFNKNNFDSIAQRTSGYVSEGKILEFIQCDLLHDSGWEDDLIERGIVVRIHLSPKVRELDQSVINTANVSRQRGQRTVGTVISHFWKSTGFPRVDHTFDTPKRFIERAFWKNVDASMTT